MKSNKQNKNDREVSIVYEDREVAEIKKGDHAYVVTDISTFYGESGGQQGDMGVLIWKKGKAEVRDTKKYSGIIVHEVDVIEGSLTKGMSLSLNIDSDRRNGLAIHHSATHLLHESLRRHLGDHISQKGSMVAPDRLRFDISHNKPINKEDIIYKGPAFGIYAKFENLVVGQRVKKNVMPNTPITWDLILGD